MKNKKLDLQQIKIESFVTKMVEEVSETIKGGGFSSGKNISCNCTYPTSPLCDLSTENVNVCPY